MAELTTILPPSGIDFRGYFLREDGTWEANNCASTEGFYTKNQFALCCDVGNTDCVDEMVTSCAGIQPVATSTYDCGDGSFCRTLLVYDQFPVTSANPTTNIICADPAFSIGVLYRTVITPVLATSSPSTTSSPEKVTPVKSSGSKGVLAGAIAGSVTGLAIIIAMAVWILVLRRRLKQKLALPQPQALPPPPPPPGSQLDSSNMKVYEADDDSQFVELPAESKPSRRSNQQFS